MPSCPVCGDDFPNTIGELRFQRHVNRCLDGVPDNEPILTVVPQSPSSLLGAPTTTSSSNGLPSSGMKPAVSSGLLSLDDDSSSVPSPSPLVVVGDTHSPPPLHLDGTLKPSTVMPVTNGCNNSEGATSAAAATVQRGGTTMSQHDSSEDFFSAIAQNVAYIGELFPDFPSSMVEELLVATGNNRELAVSLLCDSREVQQPKQGDESPPPPDSRNTETRQRKMRKVLSSQYLQGITSQLSRQGHTYHVTRTTATAQEEEDDDDGKECKEEPAAAASSSALQQQQQQHQQQPQSSLVELVVYDLQPDRTIAKRIGLGAYHSGVVVYKHEFSFGGSRNMKRDTGKSGIWSTRSLYRTASVVKKRQVLGRTYFTPSEIRVTLKEWGSSAWRVDDYHLLSKNCNHFADAFLKFLAEKSVLILSDGASSVAPVATKSAVSAATPITSTTASETNGLKGTAVTVNIPAGATPLISYTPSSLANQGQAPIVTSDHASTSSSTQFVVSSPNSSPNGCLKSCPVFPLPPSAEQAVREVFQLPSWVNRAAKLGDAVIPDFILKKVLDALMPPVPDEAEPETPAAAPGGEVGAAPAPLREAGISSPAAAASPGRSVEHQTEQSAKASSQDEALRLMKSILEIDSDEVCAELLHANGDNVEQAVLAFFSSKGNRATE